MPQFHTEKESYCNCLQLKIFSNFNGSTLDHETFSIPKIVAKALVRSL